jgi:plasmid maintenance system antidote protein VapI
MLKKKRARNLGFIRWMSGGHKTTAKKMTHITNPCYVSKMINGEKAISDSTARKIENAFGLPELWLDRDNEGLIKISSDGVRLLPEEIPLIQQDKLRATRCRNLDMIRWMCGGQNCVAKKLGHIVNPTYLGKMATGKMDIANCLAREIEKVLDLPELWLDRDNEQLLKISGRDYEQLPFSEATSINYMH